MDEGIDGMGSQHGEDQGGDGSAVSSHTHLESGSGEISERDVADGDGTAFAADAGERISHDGLEGDGGGEAESGGDFTGGAGLVGGAGAAATTRSLAAWTSRCKS